MEYKTPKVLEKKPVIAGFDLKTIVVMVSCLLLFLFTVFTSFLLSTLFILLGILYIRIQQKYPQKGQLKLLIRFRSEAQCVRMQLPLSVLIRKRGGEK